MCAGNAWAGSRYVHARSSSWRTCPAPAVAALPILAATMSVKEQLGGEQEKPLLAPHFLLKSTLPTIFANMLRGQFFMILMKKQ